MRKTIPSILVVGVLFLALGVLDVWRGVAPLFNSGGHPRLASDDILVLAIGVAALIGGTFALRGRNWARWLLAAWMAFHVAISVGKPTEGITEILAAWQRDADGTRSATSPVSTEG